MWSVPPAEDFRPVSENTTAQPSEFRLIFCTGLGAVQLEVQSVQVAHIAELLARTLNAPMANIADVPAPVPPALHRSSMTGDRLYKLRRAVRVSKGSSGLKYRYSQWPDSYSQHLVIEKA